MNTLLNCSSTHHTKASLALDAAFRELLDAQAEIAAHRKTLDGIRVNIANARPPVGTPP